MTIKTLALGALISALALAAQAGERTVTLLVPGMYCASCPYAVQAALKEVPGVKSVKTSLEDKTAVVVYDDEQATIEDLTFATLSYGYESRPLEAETGNGGNS